MNIYDFICDIFISIFEDLKQKNKVFKVIYTISTIAIVILIIMFSIIILKFL